MALVHRSLAVLVDYIRDFGHLTFAEKPFCDEDNIALCEAFYMDIERAAPNHFEDEPMPFHVMADKILGFSGLKPYFDVICGSNLDGSMSDKYLLINTCLAQCGFTDKSRVYMVGDRFYDIEGAKAVGVHPVGVTYGFGCREEFLEAGAEYIVDSPKEVARMITDSI